MRLSEKADFDWIEEFKDRWHEADDKGVAGMRVAYALKPILVALAAERDRADRAEVELDAVTSLDVDHFMDIWDSLPRVSYTTRVAMAQAAVELIKQATA